MIWKNLAPDNYTFLLPFGPSTSAGGAFNIPGQYPVNTTTAFLTEFWGDLANSPFTCTWSVVWNTPTTGSYNGAFADIFGDSIPISASTLLTSGYWRVYITGLYMTEAAGNYTWGWTKVDVYYSINGGAEVPTHFNTPRTFTGTGFTECANYTDFDATVSGLVPIFGNALDFDATAATCSGTNNNSGTFDIIAAAGPGGYKRDSVGADPTIYDTATAPGSCSCLAALYQASGPDSYNVSVSSDYQFSLTNNAIIGPPPVNQTCPCPADPNVFDYYIWTKVQTISKHSTECQIKASTSAVTNQTESNAWDCSVIGAGSQVDTSGMGGPFVTMPGSTICGGTRTVTHETLTYNCFDSLGPTGRCFGYTVPPYCFAWQPVGCHYDGSVISGWGCSGVTPTCLEVYHYQSEDGEMHEACITNTGDIRYRWSWFTEPIWQNDTVITTGGGWSAPCMMVDEFRTIELRAVYTNQGGGDPLASGVYRMWSTDSGLTFNPVSMGALAPQLVMASALQPVIRGDLQGGTLSTYYVPNSGSSGPGTIWATYRGPADVTFGSPYQLVDNTSAPLATDGSGYSLDICAEEAGRWSLAMVKVGDSLPSHWYSAQDNGASWLEF